MLVWSITKTYIVIIIITKYYVFVPVMVKLCQTPLWHLELMWRPHFVPPDLQGGPQAHIGCRRWVFRNLFSLCWNKKLNIYSNASAVWFCRRSSVFCRLTFDLPRGLTHVRLLPFSVHVAADFSQGSHVHVQREKAVSQRYTYCRLLMAGEPLLPRVIPSRHHRGNGCRGEPPSGTADLGWLWSIELQSIALVWCGVSWRSRTHQYQARSVSVGQSGFKGQTWGQLHGQVFMCSFIMYLNWTYQKLLIRLSSCHEVNFKAIPSPVHLVCLCFYKKNNWIRTFCVCWT